mmetsp:Transcript_7213/g.15025  ORF Transcript_7213/g.15025 Transcript_7213/m.15025 type:complete len:214 (+) Transcript_7213:707-1348(+)
MLGVFGATWLVRPVDLHVVPRDPRCATVHGLQVLPRLAKESGGGQQEGKAQGTGNTTPDARPDPLPVRMHGAGEVGLAHCGELQRRVLRILGNVRGAVVEDLLASAPHGVCANKMGQVDAPLRHIGDHRPAAPCLEINTPFCTGAAVQVAGGTGAHEGEARRSSGRIHRPLEVFDGNCEISGARIGHLARPLDFVLDHQHRVPPGRGGCSGDG